MIFFYESILYFLGWKPPPQILKSCWYLLKQEILFRTDTEYNKWVCYLWADKVLFFIIYKGVMNWVPRNIMCQKNKSLIKWQIQHILTFLLYTVLLKLRNPRLIITHQDKLFSISSWINKKCISLLLEQKLYSSVKKERK